MKKAIVLALVLFGTTEAYATKVEPCNFEDPWRVIRVVSNEEVEYKYKEEDKKLYLADEARILKGKGWETCKFKLKNGVSLVVPNWYDSEKETVEAEPERMPWVKVGNTSYPIKMRNLLVVEEPGKEIFLVQKQNAEHQYQQPLLAGTNEPVEKEAGWCSGWWAAPCIIGGIIAIGLIANSNKGNDQPATITGGRPTDPAP